MEEDALQIVAVCDVDGDSSADAELADLLEARPCLQLVGDGDLRAVVTSAEIPERHPEATDALRRRHEFLESLCDRLPTIPVRYGCRVPSMDWLHERLRDQSDEVRAVLDRIGFRRERVLRIERPDDKEDDSSKESSDAGRGRAYLERRSRDIARPPTESDPQWAWWRDRLADICVATEAVLQPANTYEWFPERHLEIALLTDRSSGGELVDDLRSLASRRGSRPHLGQPIPPYSFAELPWRADD